MKIDDPHQSTRLAAGNVMHDNLLADLMRQAMKKAEIKMNQPYESLATLIDLIAYINAIIFYDATFIVRLSPKRIKFGFIRPPNVPVNSAAVSLTDDLGRELPAGHLQQRYHPSWPVGKMTGSANIFPLPGPSRHRRRHSCIIAAHIAGANSRSTTVRVCNICLNA